MGIFKGNTFFVDLQFLFAKRFISVWKSLWGLKVKTYLGGLDDRHLVSLFCWEVISQRIYSLQLHKETASLRGKNLYVFQVERLEEGIGHIMDSPDICTYIIDREVSEPQAGIWSQNETPQGGNSQEWEGRGRDSGQISSKVEETIEKIFLMG